MNDGGRREKRGSFALFDGVGAVLFDLDGTLIDTHIDFPAMKLEMLRLVAAQGLNSDGLRRHDILAIVEEGVKQIGASDGDEAARAFRADAFNRLSELEAEQCAAPVELPGAADLVTALRADGVKVGIVTRNCRNVATALIVRGRLHCDALVTRDDVARTKPDPEHLREALRLMGLHMQSPSSVVMVGDHWMDVLAGRRAGCRTVGLLRGRESVWFDRATPDVILDTIGELADAYANGRELPISRRELLVLAGAGAAVGGIIGPVPPTSRAASRTTSKEERGMDLEHIPSYCTHEHWGSLASLGMTPEGFMADVVCGALPQRRTGLFDIVLDPYFGGWLAGAGVDIGEVAREAGVPGFHQASPDQAARCWRAMRPHMFGFANTGILQAFRRGLLSLYGVDITTASDAGIVQLERKVGEAYSSLYTWYETAMRKANLVRPIRPVHPEFFWSRDETANRESEARMFRPIMRIDPLLDLWPAECPRRDALAKFVGVDPSDPPSWRRFLVALMERAAQHQCVGIKQLQAYSRNLDFGPVGDNEVKLRGALNERERLAFQNWVVHECCKLADDRGWPHQIHTGTHNLPHSNPMPLAAMAQRYRRMRLVLLHCWPYLTETGWLAWQHPNVYLDGCWMPIINPAYLREALERWLGLVSHTKVTCGHDSTSVEMAIGSAHVLREAVGGFLDDAVRRGVLNEGAAMEVARDLLHRNAERLYPWPGAGSQD